jgi:transcriptional regulator with XRE-family HTH domain
MRGKRGTREVPEDWLEAVGSRIEAWIERNGLQKKTGRQIAPMLGISQPTLTQLINRKGALGIHVLMALRASMKMSLDELLGLEEIPRASSVPPKMAVEDVRAVLREEKLAPEEIRAVLREELAALGISVPSRAPGVKKKNSR